MQINDINKQINTIRIYFIYPDNTKIQIDVPIGENILKYAHKNNIMIVANCGGNMSCATCAIMVEKQMFLSNAHIQDISDEELDIIESNDYINYFNTRLCCQLTAHISMHNIILYVFNTSYGHAH